MNQRGLDLIKAAEGCKLEAYKCPAGVWTIGFGHTADVYPKMRITKKQAEELLESDLIKYEGIVQSLVKVPLNENQFSALVSFVYNVGATAFKKSTLLKYLNDGLYTAAAFQFIRWDKIAGQRSQGLYNRRLAEQALFNLPEERLV